jgi:hypothetical protein
MEPCKRLFLRASKDGEIDLNTSGSEPQKELPARFMCWSLGLLISKGRGPESWQFSKEMV